MQEKTWHISGDVKVREDKGTRKVLEPIKWWKALPLLLLGILFLHASCSSIECPIQNTVFSVYSIKDGSAAADTLKDTILIWTVRHDGKDTLLLYNRGVNLSTFNLPISYTNEEDTLYFYCWKDNYAELDTVWIRKTNTPHFESVDCSASYFHEITSVRTTHHAIDSLIIHYPIVDYEQKEHFYIRFKAHS
jgi:hypothetical protein